MKKAFMIVLMVFVIIGIVNYLVRKPKNFTEFILGSGKETANETKVLKEIVIIFYDENGKEKGCQGWGFKQHPGIGEPVYLKYQTESYKVKLIVQVKGKKENDEIPGKITPQTFIDPKNKIKTKFRVNFEDKKLGVKNTFTVFLTKI